MPFHDKVTPLWGPVPVASIQGTLALDLQPRLDPPEIRSAPCLPGADVHPTDLPVRRELDRWARTYVQAAVEIVGGDRPVTQLVRWTTPGVYQDLGRRAQLVGRAGRHQPGLGHRQVVRPQVRSIHTCFVAREAVEVSAHVRYGERSRAVAARFQLIAGRWQCCALEFA